MCQSFFLELIGVQEDDRKSLLQKLEENPFVSIQKEFGSYYKIDKHVQTSGNYIAPLCFKLPPRPDGVVPTFQYIPVIQLLETIITSEGLQLSTPAPVNFFSDIKDGSCWKNNPFFVENPDAYAGQLYSDAVEIVNPLGPAKGAHKIVNIYFSLVDMDKSLRCKTENIFLLLTVKDIDMKNNRELVYKPLLEDLLKLESGVQIGAKVVKLGIICHSGDNLEQHQVGGFSACFSSKDICRVCHLQYDELATLTGIPSASPWTREEYDEACGTGQYGVNSECLLNKLKAFHCVGQMPLDPMHDFMEKIGACDALFVLKTLITQGLFTLTAYNSVLKNTKLEGYESSDRPPAVKESCTKLPGKAMAVSLHIKLMPFIVWQLMGGSVEMTDVLDLLVLLHRINEFLLADKFHLGDIDSFQELLVDYFAKRNLCEEQFPFVLASTPKWHFLGMVVACLANYGTGTYVFYIYYQYIPVHSCTLVLILHFSNVRIYF
jgi:hypothetical protein